MKLLFKTGNIVDEQVEALVCSGNVQLNMSGGVNGELLAIEGAQMQGQLHAHLKDLGVRYVDPGFVKEIKPSVTQFKCIVYTVSIDAFYDSSVEMVKEALANALELIQHRGCKSVAIPALATGYGHLSKSDFAKALFAVLNYNVWDFTEVRIVLLDDDALQEIQSSYCEIDNSDMSLKDAQG